jgi:hypothetical protein
MTVGTQEQISGSQAKRHIDGEIYAGTFHPEKEVKGPGETDNRPPEAIRVGFHACLLEMFRLS